MRTWGVFALVAALYAAARLWRLDAYSLRPDEIFSLQTARLPWPDLVGAAIRDVVHPPLFYALLKLWIGIGGDAEPWLRLLPVLFSVATLPPLVLLGRRLGLSWSAVNLAALLMAANAYLIYFAQELRMYSLLPLLTVCSLWLLLRYRDAEGEARGELAALFAANLLLVWTHYFGWLVVAGEGVVLLAGRRERARAFALATIALLALFLPWAWLAMRASLARGGLGSSIGSFAPPGLVGDLGAYYAMLAGTLDSRALSAIGIALLNAPVLLLAARALPPGANVAGATVRRESFRVLALFAFVPVLVVFALSRALPHSIWGVRQLTFVAVPYLLLAAMSLDALAPTWLRRGAIAIIAAYAVAAGVRGLDATGRNDWRPLVAAMIAAEPARDPGVVVYAFGSMDEVIDFYAKEAGDERFAPRRIGDPTALHGEHFWVAYRESARFAPLAALEARGYRVGPALRDGYGGVLAPAWRRMPSS